jgi:hypothetical protein
MGEAVLKKHPFDKKKHIITAREAIPNRT